MRSLQSLIWLNLIVLTLNSGCTLFSGKKDDPTQIFADSSIAEAKGDSVVFQVGSEKPMLSKYPRKHWVALRNSNKNSTKKLAATLAAGEWSVAEKEARFFLEKHPHDQESMQALAVALIMQVKTNMAMYYIERSQELFGDSPELYNLKGLAITYMAKGKVEDFRNAERYFAEAFNSGSKQVAAGLNLGALQLEMGNAEAAAATYDSVADRCGGCRAGLLGAGMAHKRLGHYTVAEQKFQELLSRNAKDATALYHLALVQYYGDHKEADAKSNLEKLLAQSSDREQDIRRKAQILMRKMEAEKSPTNRPAALVAGTGKDSDSDNSKVKEGSAVEVDSDLLQTMESGE